MIQLHKYPPVTGPYRRDIGWPAVVLSLLAHAAIGTILAVSVVGMTGAFDEEKPIQVACVQCAGGAR